MCVGSPCIRAQHITSWKETQKLWRVMNFKVIKNRTFGSSDQLLMNNICFVDSEIVLKVILMHVIIVLMYNVCILSTCIQVLGQTTERYGPVTVGCSDTWVASICQIQAWFITRLQREGVKEGIIVISSHSETMDVLSKRFKLKILI